MRVAMRPSASTIIVVLATWLAGAGCTPSDNAGEAEPALGPISVVTSYTQVVLPLDAYMQSGDEIELDGYASNRLIQRCMRRFGLDWAVRVPGPRSDTPRNDRRYGIVDATQAARYGYSAPDVEEAKPATGPPISDDQVAVLTGRGQNSFNGVAVPDGGCAGEARHALEAGAPPLGTAGSPNLVEQLNHDAGAKADSDRRVRAVFDQWSSCMKESGYNYAGPWDANDDPHWSDAQVTRQEIATAVADVACRTRTNLVGMWYAVETAYQKDAIEQYAPQLAECQSYVDNRNRNVARVIAETADTPSPGGPGWRSGDSVALPVRRAGQ